MAGRLRSFDWRGHPLGEPSGWPGELRVLVGVCLSSSVPTAIYWGPDLQLIYNDAWSSIPAERHPSAVGSKAREVWSDIWDVVGPQFEAVLASGRGFSAFDQRLDMLRGGRVEETFWNYSLTPIAAADGRVLGILNQGYETTDRVLASRNQAFMLDLGERLHGLDEGDIDAPGALSIALGALGRRIGLSRAGYATIEARDGSCSIVATWSRGGDAEPPAESLDLGGAGADLLPGATVTSDDVSADGSVPAETAAMLLASGVRARLVAPVVRNGRAVAFVFLHDDAPRRWSRHEIDLAGATADRIRDELERADSLARLRESERRFSTIFDQAAVGMSEVDQRGRFVRFNASMARILGRDPAEASELTVAGVTHPADIGESRAHLRDQTQPGAPFELEKRYVRPDGSLVWAVTQVTQLVDDRNQPNGFFSVTTDITERKEQERIRAWLIAELNHRVKNNLATVQSLARQTLRSARTLDEFGAAFDSRIMALARAHELLMRETWTSAALGELVVATLAPFALDGEERVVIRGPDVRFSPTAAVTMTLALHELATNAAKFGALSSPDGRVTVEWRLDMSGEAGEVDLTWRESGGPHVAQPVRRGFGSRLIERGAPRELGGAVRLDFDPAGVACAFRLPLSQKISTP